MNRSPCIEIGIGKTAKKIFGLAHPVRQPGTRDGLSYYTIVARCLSSVIVRVGRRLACCGGGRGLNGSAMRPAQRQAFDLARPQEKIGKDWKRLELDAGHTKT